MPNYQIAQPLEIDHMPAEVATEMLARGRLTNRQRKQCFAARERVFGSGVPLLRRTQAELSPDRATLRELKISVPYVFDAEFSPPTMEEYLAARHARIPIDRLGRLVTRSIRARRRAQTVYAKLVGDESKQAIKLRRLLDLAAAHHEAIQDSAQITINVRLHLAKLRPGTVQ